MLGLFSLSTLWIRGCCECGARGLAPWCESCHARGPRETRTPGQLRVTSPCSFSDPTRRLVRELKYHDQTIIAAHLGAAMARAFPRDWQDATLVPLPLHVTRLAERGFNQSALLARSVAKKRHMKVSHDLVERSRATRPQARLGADERRENMSEAFALRCPAGRARALRTRVVLVDDVVTTGATVDACARVLQSANVDVLGVLCAAIADHDP